jgi:hypothetical protein
MVKRVALAVGFFISCALLLPFGAWLAGLSTYIPIRSDVGKQDFPVLVVAGDKAWVNILQNPHDVPPPPVGASYLVPLEKAARIERFIREHDTPGIDASWKLQVSELSSDRQRIELVRLGDGYWGGIYDATATTITPKYKKITGPLFAFVILLVTLVLKGLLWGAGFLLRRSVSLKSSSA